MWKSYSYKEKTKLTLFIISELVIILDRLKKQEIS